MRYKAESEDKQTMDYLCHKIYDLLCEEYGEEYVEVCEDGFWVMDEDLNNGYLVRVEMTT